MITEEQIKELAAELTLEDQIVLDSLTQIEERLTRIEAHLGIDRVIPNRKQKRIREQK